jgi:hypothetical protein
MRLFLCVAVSILLLATTNRMEAQMQIIGSNVAEYPVGTIIPDGLAPKVPVGGKLTVLLPSGGTRTIAGPIAPLSKDPLASTRELSRARTQEGGR